MTDARLLEIIRENTGAPHGDLCRVAFDLLRLRCDIDGIIAIDSATAPRALTGTWIDAVAA
jgi:hypothetical protein